jgi:hypothetical protein
MNRRPLSNFEERLERLIEGSFARLFRGALNPRTVAVQLARAIEDHTMADSEGRELAPTEYEVHLHPDDYVALLSQTPDLSRQLSGHVVAYCLETGLHLINTPLIRLVSAPAVPPRDLRIHARHVTRKHDTTQIMKPVDLPVKKATPPPDAQLIIDGQRTIPLVEEVINIGRHPDNNIVLSDLQVSRHHVQLRLRHGRYVIYDRQSRGGTFVNGQQINEHILAPGDVIRIGHVSVLYMEEDPRDALDDTQIDYIPPDILEG